MKMLTSLESKLGVSRGTTTAYTYIARATSPRKKYLAFLPGDQPCFISLESQVD